MVAARYRHHLTSTNVRFDPTQEAMLRRSEGPLSALHVDMCMVQQSDRSLPHHRHSRPFAAIGHHLKMLRCGPSERPFAATAKSARGELTDCGQTGLLHSQLLLTQHLHAFAVQNLRRRNDFHQTGHWIRQKRVDSKLTFRCGLPKPSRRGRSELCRFNYCQRSIFAAFQPVSSEQPFNAADPRGCQTGVSWRLGDACLLAFRG